MGSLLCGTYMLSGPLVGGLVNRFGCRSVCMVGAVVAWAAISLSTLSPTPAVLMLTYGVLGGFGLGLIYLPAIVCVGFYFGFDISVGFYFGFGICFGFYFGFGICFGF